jgi:hypothetical protein
MRSVDIHPDYASSWTCVQFAFLLIPVIQLKQHLHRRAEGRTAEYFLLLASVQLDAREMLRGFRSPFFYRVLRLRAHEECQGNLVPS